MRLLCYCWRICVRMSTECGGNLTLGLQKKKMSVYWCYKQIIHAWLNIFFYNVECLFVLRILEWNCIHCTELGVTKDKITIKDGMDFFYHKGGPPFNNFQWYFKDRNFRIWLFYKTQTESVIQCTCSNLLCSLMYVW